MIYIVDNLMPILAATLAGLVFGWLYHRLTATSGAGDTGGITGYGAGRGTLGVGFAITALIAEIWFASILAGALILAPPKADVWVMAIGTAVVIWLGFVVPVVVVTLRYRQVAPRTVAFDCLHWLGVMVVEAVVLHSIGLVAPQV